MTKPGVSSGGGNKLLPSTLFIRDKDSGAWDETGKGFDVMREVLIPHKLLSCQSLVAGIHDNRKKTPAGVLSHSFVLYNDLLLGLSPGRWSLPGYTDEVSRNVPVTWAYSQVCRSVWVGVIDQSYPAGGGEVNWCPWPKHLAGNTLYSMAWSCYYSMLETSGEFVQCHIYRLDCLWIFHRAATERLPSDLLTSFSWLGSTELSHVSYLFTYCTIPMDSSFNVNKILHLCIFFWNLSWYQTTVSYTGEMKQELSLSLMSCVWLWFLHFKFGLNTCQNYISLATHWKQRQNIYFPTGALNVLKGA